MDQRDFQILLADDDEDDCMFFKEALDELKLRATLRTVNNGVALMDFLENNWGKLPQVLFLDLNMPLKSGAACLTEIKQSERYRHLPVVIYSTSSNMDVMDQLFGRGAQYYIQKPADFSDLKSVIGKTIQLIRQTGGEQSSREEFVIQPSSK